jgi:alpha-N-acetylglucosaminidase
MGSKLEVLVLLAILQQLAASSDGCANSIQAVQGLIQRIIPEALDRTVFECSLGNSSSDAFELETLPNKQLLIRGNNGVAMAHGFHHYLKHYAGLHVSWGDKRSGCNLKLHKGWPKVGARMRREAMAIRYYMNPCTFSYSAWNWDWERWEFEIDWMALQGVNMPLAFTGIEWVWRKIYMKLGLTAEDLKPFFAGPAFLAWHRMGNLQGWGGPLSQAWMASQNQMQKKIVARMLKFGMQPVMSCFAGHVPGALKHKYPEVAFHQAPNWWSSEKCSENHAQATDTGVWLADKSNLHRTANNSQYSCVYMVGPDEPLYLTIAKEFVAAQREEYGLSTGGHYACDICECAIVLAGVCACRCLCLHSYLCLPVVAHIVAHRR